MKIENAARYHSPRHRIPSMNEKSRLVLRAETIRECIGADENLRSEREHARKPQSESFTRRHTVRITPPPSRDEITKELCIIHGNPE